MIKVYYHKNCFDGICSAWVAWKKFGNTAQYIPINYGEDYTSLYQDCYENAIINDDIYFIDFSLPRELMDLIYNKANKLVVLDHHKTAEANLKGASYAIFDMTKSGAQLAWKWFFPDKNEPLLVSYIGDRDLWNFKIPNSKEVNAWIQSYEMSIKNYEDMQYIFNTVGVIPITEMGRSLLRYQDKLVKDMCKTYFIKEIGGYRVPVVNASVLFSEVGNVLCLTEFPSDNFDNFGSRPLFAGYYFDRDDNTRQWGLRSIGDFDVSEVAKKYGGGGHKNAAGFIEKLK